MRSTIRLVPGSITRSVTTRPVLPVGNRRAPDSPADRAHRLPGLTALAQSPLGVGGDVGAVLVGDLRPDPGEHRRHELRVGHRSDDHVLVQQGGDQQVDAPLALRPSPRASREQWKTHSSASPRSAAAAMAALMAASSAARVRLPAAAGRWPHRTAGRSVRGRPRVRWRLRIWRCWSPTDSLLVGAALQPYTTTGNGFCARPELTAPASAVTGSGRRRPQRPAARPSARRRRPTRGRARRRRRPGRCAPRWPRRPGRPSPA